MTKVYIDGQAGTTGLQIVSRLSKREDIELLKIPDEKRHDNDTRKQFIADSDFTILCLPDKASIEAVTLAEGTNTRIIDASTAHRVNENWVYGLPELCKGQIEKIAGANRVANPGCYATGFICAVSPLVQAGILTKDYPFSAHAVSGYSGAGKGAIAVYEGAEKPHGFESPRQYALTQAHKHLPEMKKYCGLEYTPAFNPIINDYYAGMVVTVPIINRLLGKKTSVDEVREVLTKHYENSKFIKVLNANEIENLGGFIDANTLEGTNTLEVLVYGNDENIIVSSRLDNLGKGASGAAVQNLNIMMGIDETTGLL